MESEAEGCSRERVRANACGGSRLGRRTAAPRALLPESNIFTCPASGHAETFAPTRNVIAACYCPYQMSGRSVEDRSSRVSGSDRSARDLQPKSRRGGRRPNAGRKPGRFRRPAHRSREPLLARHPVHVVYRLEPFVLELRTRRFYHVIRRVLACLLGMPDFRVIHVSIQNNHLLCAAAHKRCYGERLVMRS